MSNPLHTTVAITGGCGYIGTQLVSRLISANHRVIVIDNLERENKTNIYSRAVFYNTDIRDINLHKIFQKEHPDCIFHLAASKSVTQSMETPKEFYDINVYGSSNVFSAAQRANVKRIIFPSTAGVYGNSVHLVPQRETDTTNPSSVYAQTKLVTENELLSLEKKGIEGIILRFANVYGQGGNEYAEGVIGLFIKSLLQDKGITLHGDGTQTRDFIYMDDLMELCLLIKQVQYDRIKALPIFNVSTGQTTSINMIITTISQALGIHPIIIHEPSAFIGQKSSILDSTRAKEILGWTAKTSLEDGIISTIAYYKSKQNNKVLHKN